MKKSLSNGRVLFFFWLAAFCLFIADIKAQPARIPTSGVTIETVDLTIGETALQTAVSKGKSAKPVFFNLHDNENTSVAAAKIFIEKAGGTVVELRHDGGREVKFQIGKKTFRFDPNRIFTLDGIKNTLGEKNEAAAQILAVDTFAKELFERFLKDEAVVVALHNNTNGGGLTVKSYEKGGRYEKDAARVFVNPARDEDDFFFVTQESHFEAIRKKGFNVVLQDNANVTDDGSLSVFCGKRNIPYINVEAEHGHLKEQLEMLEILPEILGFENGDSKKKSEKKDR